jgi:hypothetical protein
MTGCAISRRLFVKQQTHSLMKIPIRHKHAAICFAVVSLYTFVCGLGCIALPFAWRHVYPTASFMWPLALVGIISCLVAVSCAWAARALFKRTPNAGLVAMIVWLVVGALALWSLFSLAFTGWDIVGIVTVAVLAALEILIAVYLVERRHEAAA